MAARPSPGTRATSLALRGGTPTAPLKLTATPTTQAGFFCPKGYYMHCPDGFFHGCDCIKGARFWRYWEQKPSPLYPQNQSKPGRGLRTTRRFR